MFTAEYLLESDWYRERLAVKQHRDVALWTRHLDYVDRFLCPARPAADVRRDGCAGAPPAGGGRAVPCESPQYLQELFGALGADPVEPRAKPEQRKRPAAVAVT